MEEDIKRIQKFVRIRYNKERKKRVVPKYVDEDFFSAIKRIGKGERLSENNYTKLREKTDPTTPSFYNRFGSYKNAIEILFGVEPVDIFKPVIDELYMVKVVNEYQIKTGAQYLQKRKQFPDIIPTEYYVIKLFKNYRTLFASANLYSVTLQLRKCLQVKINMSKSPDLSDYSKNGINVKLLIRQFRTLKNLNYKVRLLEEAYEISRRNRDQAEKHDQEAEEREDEKIFKSFSKQLRS